MQGAQNIEGTSSRSVGRH